MRSRSLILVLAIILGVSTCAGAEAAEDQLRILINQNTADEAWHNLRTNYAEFHRAMRECGATVDRVSIHHITEEMLTGYDILILPLTPFILDDADKTALRSFIRSGGGVLLMIWKDEYFGDNANIDGFTAEYGIRAGGSEYATHFSVADVIQASPLSGPEPAIQVRTLGHFLQIVVDSGEAEGVLQLNHNGHFVGAVSNRRLLLGDGRLVVLGDETIFQNDFIRRADGLAFARNLIRYLASEPSDPDLAIARLGLTAIAAQPGSEIAIDLTVANVGRADAPKKTVSFVIHHYNKSTKTAGEGVSGLLTVEIPALEPGKEYAESRKARIPEDIAAGRYVIVANISAPAIPGETNLANNRRLSKSFKIR